jgi:hypothetical protein
VEKAENGAENETEQKQPKEKKVRAERKPKPVLP